MPAIRAERLCPEAIFIPPDFIRYRAVSHAAREIFQRHTDLIEPLSLDEAYLDVSENKTGLPTATRVAKAIRQQIRDELQLTASAGVAPNKFLAKIASDWRKPDGLFVIQPKDLQTFLPPLPVGQIPGVGKVTETRLKQMGISTVGDLKALELAALEAQFGRYGTRLLLAKLPLRHFEWLFAVRVFSFRNRPCALVFASPEWPAWVDQKDLHLAFPPSIHDQTRTPFFCHRESLTVE